MNYIDWDEFDEEEFEHGNNTRLIDIVKRYSDGIYFIKINYPIDFDVFYDGAPNYFHKWLSKNNKNIQKGNDYFYINLRISQGKLENNGGWMSKDYIPYERNNRIDSKFYYIDNGYTEIML